MIFMCIYKNPPNKRTNPAISVTVRDCPFARLFGVFDLFAGLFDCENVCNPFAYAEKRSLFACSLEFRKEGFIA